MLRITQGLKVTNLNHKQETKMELIEAIANINASPELNPEELLDTKLQADYDVVREAFFKLPIDSRCSQRVKSIKLKRQGRFYNPDNVPTL
jgi:hypothetical protein